MTHIFLHLHKTHLTCIYEDISPFTHGLNPGFSARRADTEALNAAQRGALLSCYRYMRSLLERILTALTSRTLIIRNCFPDDNTLRMRAFLKK